MFDQTGNYDLTPVVTGSNTPWALYIVLVLLLAITIWFFWYRSKIKKRSLVQRSLDVVFLEIQVPRESSQDEYGQEATKQNEKELVGIAEQLFTTLSFPTESGWRHFWYGQDSISLEIVAYDKKIHFYIVAPKKLQAVIEHQVNAQYPKATIEEVAPYKLFPQGNQIAATELVLQRKYFLPIKSYQEQNTDPLNAITNAMSKLAPGDTLAMQLVITPATTKWGNMSRKLAQDLQKGKKPKELESYDFGKAAFELGKTVGQEVFGSSKPKEQQSYQPVILTPMQQELIKRLEEKASHVGFHANLRLVATADNQNIAETNLNGLMAAFTQYSLSPFNGFKAAKIKTNQVAQSFILRFYHDRDLLLNATELASIWHPPTRFAETPNIAWLTAKLAPAPVNMPLEGTLLGINTFRGVKTEVRLLDKDRMRHVYIIGSTGVGKTEVMKNMALQDIKAGHGICIVDPHGEFVEEVLANVPKERSEDVILFDPSDTERPFGLNMLDVNNEAQKDFAVQEMISIFYALFPPDYLGPMFEHYMRNVMLTLIADINDPGTLVEIPRMFTDKEFQARYVSRIKDPNVRAFWEQEMSKTDFARSGGEMLGYLISKLGRFIENELMRNIIGQQRSSFDFRKIMDERKILLVNLSKGKIGEINAKLLGLIIVSKLQMAALSRADVPENERRDFYLYVDEFQNFVTDAFAIILSEARKYRLGLTLAHQYLGQLTAEKPGASAQDTKVRDAVFGNVGTKIVFRVGADDSEVLAREFNPTFSQFDLINIERFHAYVKLMIENTVAKPFSMATLAFPQGDTRLAKAYKELSRLKFGRAREQVEAEIMERSQLNQYLDEIKKFDDQTVAPPARSAV